MTGFLPDWLQELADNCPPGDVLQLENKLSTYSVDYVNTKYILLKDGKPMTLQAASMELNRLTAEVATLQAQKNLTTG
jgi:hypothetical protein